MAGTTAARITIGVFLVLLVLALGWAASRRARQSGRPDGTLRDHIDDLRRRIMWSVLAVGVGVFFAFSFRLGPEPWWLPRPALHDTLAAQMFTILSAHIVPANVQLVVLRPFDGLSAELTLSLGLGAVLASPVVLNQLGGFLLPALREKERKAVKRAFLPVLLLFLLGAAFALWFVVPAIMDALYGYADALGATPLLSVADAVSFATMMSLLFGIAFQTPLAMTVLSRGGVVEPRTWAKFWRHAVVAILILCAFVVDGTVVTLLLVAAPLFGLYCLGILGAFAFGKSESSTSPG